MLNAQNPNKDGKCYHAMKVLLLTHLHGKIMINAI